jgi:hypothetical protein
MADQLALFLSSIGALSLYYKSTLYKLFVIIVGGWILAWVMKWTVQKFFVYIKFDTASEKAGINDVLKKGNIVRTPSQLVGSFVYWIILFWILISVVNALGLTVVAEGLNDLWQYLPQVIGAVIILVFGLFFANVLSGIVRTATANATIQDKGVLGTLTKYAVIIFTITVSLKQLGISGISTVFNIFFSAVCFGLALAFGLGCKDIAGNWINDLIKKQKEKP